MRIAFSWGVCREGVSVTFMTQILKLSIAYVGFIYCKEVLQERGRDAFISRDEYERGGCPEVRVELLMGD